MRNPNWDKSTDFRPAYLDKIVVNEGNDITVANRKILQGQSMVGNQADLQAPPAILKEATTNYKSQYIAGPFTGRFRYIALNTKVKPFDNINVRKAVIAAMNKNALRLAFGGPLVGDIPTHFLSPSIAGFDQAGGHERPQPRLHAHAQRRHGAGNVVHEEGGLPEREVHRRRARSRWSPTAPRRRRRWPRRR